MTKKKVQRGFTLIEVLVALFIFGVVISLVFESFREISFSAKLVDQSSAEFEMANACLLRMASDLESVFIHQRPGYIEPGFDATPDSYRFKAENETIKTNGFPVIRFTSLSHLPVNRDFKKGIAEIVYYVDEDESGGFVLRRLDRISFDKPFERKKTDPVLCRKIKSMVVKYYNAEGGEFEEWDSESEEYSFATPSYISITIETGEEDSSFTFSTRVSLNSVREAKKEK